MMATCRVCGVTLTGDEIGLYRKIISRSACSFLCIDCLAGDLGCQRELLERKIHQFKKLGCGLFPPLEDEVTAFKK